MNARQKLFARVILTVFVFVCFFTLFSGKVHASGNSTARQRSGSKMPLRISVQDNHGNGIASSDAHTSSTVTSAELTFNHEYQPGDHIVIRGPQNFAVKLDETFPDCLLYLPDSSLGKFDYELPFGRAEQQTGSAYAPESFAGNSHRVTARVLTRNERTGYRNLALNPCDSVLQKDAPTLAFPHSITNSYARNLFDFAARNAIDGVAQNGHHGVWPYQSWGPEMLPELWWKLDFGRSVELDKIRLMIRADFPHDSYWKNAVVEFSDGSLLPIQISSSAEFQEFNFPRRKVSWFQITKLAPADPTKWCSFIEVEAWGHDLPSDADAR